MRGPRSLLPSGSAQGLASFPFSPPSLTGLLWNHSRAFRMRGPQAWADDCYSCVILKPTGTGKSVNPSAFVACCRYSAGSPQALRGGVLPDGVLLESGRAAAEAARLRPPLLQ